MISAFLAGNEKKCFQTHVSMFAILFRIQHQVGSAQVSFGINNQIKKTAFYSCIDIFFSEGIGQYYCPYQYTLSEDWLLGWCVYLLQRDHCEAIIFTKSFL